MATARKILSDAMKLPEQQRTRVALRLLDSVEPPDPMRSLNDDAWVAEIERRAKRAVAGRARASTWVQVRARLSRKLGL